MVVAGPLNYINEHVIFKLNRYTPVINLPEEAKNKRTRADENGIIEITWDKNG